MFIGSDIISYWKHLIEKYKAKLETWKGKWLSSTGRLMMVKSVLFALLVFSMTCLRLPSNIEEDLIKIMRNFLWNGLEDKRKFPSIALNKVSQLKSAGGAGIRQIYLMNLAMGAKLVWEICSGGSQK